MTGPPASPVRTAPPDPRLALLANRLGALATALTDMVGFAEGDAAGPETAALNTVSLWPGTRIDELAAILGLSHSGAVRVVDRLAKRGLIERRPHPSDARAAALHATGAGEALADGVQQHRLARLTALVHTLPRRRQERLAETIEDLLRLLAHDVPAADRICRFCDERLCTPEICPTEHWARAQGTGGAGTGRASSADDPP